MGIVRDFWSQPKTRSLLIFFIILICVLVFSLFFQKKQMKQQMKLKVQFIEQKNMLRDELDDLIDEHDDLLSEYGDLNQQLHKQDSIIQKQISEIRNLIRTKNDLKEARKKIESLKEISKRYLANIDSLLVVNEILSHEKDSVIKVNKDINWKNYKLNKKNEELFEQVNKGSVLDVFDVSVDAFRYRSTGKEVITQTAKKVQNIRCCFFVAANPIAIPKKREVFLQLIDEQGEVLKTRDSIITNLDEVSVECTATTDFEYNNNELEVCVEWERVDILVKGIYQLNIIIEGRLAGQTAFQLK